MSREKTIWDSRGKLAIFQDDVLIWRRSDNFSNKMSDLPTPMIMRDIEPYKNMINGQMITSRSAHRELLKRHNCVEVGNDTSHIPKKRDKITLKTDRKKTLHSQLADVSEKALQSMVKAEIKARRLN